MIIVKDLHYSYPEGATALQGVSLSIEEGERVAILGENGAGKTTLVKHFNGLLRSQQGSVLVNGLDTAKVSVAELAKHVGFIFQNPDYQLFGETVEEEVAFALRNFGHPADVVAKRVESVLRLFEIEKYRARSPLALSDGERKRVALASVLSYEPEIVVFDEPTVGQDQAQKDKIAGLMNQLKFQGKTVICITHDMEFVAENFDRVIIMSQGRIVQDGKTREILTQIDVLREARLLPVQMTELAWNLSEKGVPKDVLTVSEMVTVLRRLMKVGEAG